MLLVYNILKKSSKLLINLILIVQIILLILIFLTAGYWFCNAAGINFLAFVQPLAAHITSFVHSFYHQQAQVGEQSFDGSILLFDILAFIVIIFLSKLKIEINKYQDDIDVKIRNTQLKLEQDFNKQLERETKSKLNKFNNYAILIKIELKNCKVNNAWGEVQNIDEAGRENQIFRSLNTCLNTFNNIKTAKTGNKYLILADKFNTFDKIMTIVVNELATLKLAQRKERWIMDATTAVATYRNSGNNEVKNVYNDLQTLIDLDLKGEAICLGNFSMRYEMSDNSEFIIEKKGHYDINDNDISVWKLIKKI
ncbi:MAG: hypothetical protein LKG27_07905 [Clostridiaceae bacterium]|jgi:hypothetical protein|nr:hypothetical protein [Clostridiaceae bacterium]